jgi:hypothetical protein
LWRHTNCLSLGGAQDKCPAFTGKLIPRKPGSLSLWRHQPLLRLISERYSLA